MTRRLKIPEGIPQSYFTGKDRVGFTAPKVSAPLEKQYVVLCIRANLPAGFQFVDIVYDPMYWPTTKVHLTLLDASAVKQVHDVSIGSVRPWGPQVAKRLCDYLNRVLP